MAESKTAEQPKAKSAEPKFTLEKLGQHCGELFGVTSSTFAGATLGLKSGMYTVAEVKEAINKWKNKEAK